MNARFKILFLVSCLAVTAGSARAQVVIDGQRHHLGTPGRPEWDEFADDEPEGRTLVLRFDSRPNDREATLIVRQRDVKFDWDVRLNDRSLGRLLTMEPALVHALSVPPGTLRDGPNTLSIAPATKADDDVVIDELILDPRPLRETLGRCTPRRPRDRLRQRPGPPMPDHDHRPPRRAGPAGRR